MKKYWSMSRFFKKRKHRYKFVASFFFFFNLDLLYFTVKRTWFPFLRCELDIGSIRGWNCFRPCLWSWVSQLCLAKWTAYIRGQRRVGCRVLLKGHRGKKEKKKSSGCLPVLFLSAEGHWHVAAMYGSTASPVSDVESKQSGWWRAGRLCVERGLS